MNKELVHVLTKLKEQRAAMGLESFESNMQRMIEM